MSQTSTFRRTTKPLMPVCGKVRVVKPIGSVGNPELQQGEIEINGKPYFCRCLAHGYSLFTFDRKSGQTKNYDLPADLSSCECMDYLSRSDRREDGRCKHQKALAALVAAGKLPQVEVDPVDFNRDPEPSEDAYIDQLAEMYEDRYALACSDY